MPGIVLAFKRFRASGPQSGIFGSAWMDPWYENFRFIFRSGDATRIIRNTLGYNAVFIVLGTAFAVFIALALNEMRQQKLARFYQGIFIIPHLLSWVVVSYLVEAFLSVNQGLLNTAILPRLGIERMFWYSDPRPWPFIFPLLDIFKSAGYSSVVYYAAILGVDPELYEAATIDGATRIQQLRRITIPLITPVIIVLVTLAIGRIFYADFGLFYQVPRNSGALYSATMVIDTYVFNALTRLANIGMAAAAGLFQSLVGFVLVLASNALVRRVSKDAALF